MANNDSFNYSNARIRYNEAMENAKIYHNLGFTVSRNKEINKALTAAWQLGWKDASSDSLLVQIGAINYTQMISNIQRGITEVNK